MPRCPAKTKPVLAVALPLLFSIWFAPNAGAVAIGEACGVGLIPRRCDEGLECRDRVCVCVSNSACDDGIFCNGEERCSIGRCVAGEDVCLAGQACDELSRRCVTDCGRVADGDGDGVASIACGGSDCDDEDPRRFPGNIEVCDEEGHDEDCNPRTVGSRDLDGDGFVDATCWNARE